jgi:hypothetical protein
MIMTTPLGFQMTHTRLSSHWSSPGRTVTTRIDIAVQSHPLGPSRSRTSVP